MYFPKCFPDHKTYREWVGYAKQARENVSPCEDCLVSYELKMKSQGRCERNWLTKNLVIGRKSLSQGMFE
jgi:hypothetical protein